MDQAGEHVVHSTPASLLPGWAELIDLAGARLGGRTLACSDDFFAGMESLLKPERAVFIPGKFTARGKWMDGWESRRKRVPGHDWCVIRLGEAGKVRGVCVDTAHFNGNQPEYCTLEGAEIAGGAGGRRGQGAGGARGGGGGAAAALKTAEWVEIIPRTPLNPGSEHYIGAAVSAADRRFTHVRLNIFPDGGVARLRVHGEVLADWPALMRGRTPVELSGAKHGGLVIGANNMHFGSRHNLIMPDRAPNMGDGWETRRKRGLTWADGRPVEHDWAIVRLGHRGTIGRVEIDTHHFKGNFPESAMVEVCDVPDDASALRESPAAWRTLVPRSKLKADHKHVYVREIDRNAAARPCTHARLSIYPDGGVSRLRLWGRPVA